MSLGRELLLGNAVILPPLLLADAAVLWRELLAVLDFGGAELFLAVSVTRVAATRVVHQLLGGARHRQHDPSSLERSFADGQDEPTRSGCFCSSATIERREYPEHGGAPVTARRRRHERLLRVYGRRVRHRRDPGDVLPPFGARRVLVDRLAGWDSVTREGGYLKREDRAWPPLPGWRRDSRSPPGVARTVPRSDDLRNYGA